MPIRVISEKKRQCPCHTSYEYNNDETTTSDSSSEGVVAVAVAK